MPLEVVEFGFSEVSGPVYYGIIVENPNTEWAVFGTGVEITFLDGSGNELTTVGGLIANLLPGQTAAIGDNSFSGAGAKSMKVELVEGEWVPMAATPDALTVSDVVTRTAGGQMTTTGSITSTLDQPLDFVVVSAIYRNDAGKIIGGAHAITQVAGAGETPFEIQALEPLPAKSTEAYLSY